MVELALGYKWGRMNRLGFRSLSLEALVWPIEDRLLVERRSGCF